MGHDDGNLAGWHRDPSGRHELRFWGGDAWTEHVIDEGIPGLDFPTRSGRAPEGTASAAPPPPIPAASDEVDARAPAKDVQPEPEIEPVVAEAEAEPEPEIEPVVAEAAVAEAEVEPEPEIETDVVDLSAAELEAEAEIVDLPAAEAETIEPEARESATDAPALVPTASVLTPSRESETVADTGPNFVAIPPTPPPTWPAGPGSSRPGGRGLRSRRRANPPVPPIASEAATLPPSDPAESTTSEAITSEADMPDPIAPDTIASGTPIQPEPTSVERERLVASTTTEGETDTPIEAASPSEPRSASDSEPGSASESASEPASGPVTERAEPDEPVQPVEPARGVTPIRLVAESPTVASPAGNTAGSNTSAIADPHRAARTTRAANTPPPDGPRVAGISPVPVKRYRPGSPPASPLAGPRALPAPTAPIGTVVTPWYRKTSSWLAVLAIGAVVALVVVLISVTSGDNDSKRIGGRPPAAAPAGHKVIDGDGFGIAAPAGWIVATDPGDTFPQLRRTNWGTPLAATDTQTIAGEALIVVPLHSLAHEPQVDPELFWSDQVKDAATTRSIKPGPPLSVHGFRANEITATDPSGKALVAASIDTGDRTFLVAVTATTPEAAQTEFDQLIQTFDAR